MHVAVHNVVDHHTEDERKTLSKIQMLFVVVAFDASCGGQKGSRET
jgi:hypothetical protein